MDADIPPLSQDLLTDYTEPQSLIANPFGVLKANDLSDIEVLATWVDLPGALVTPPVAIPLVLLGGKGSGRTHLMRYLSAKLQSMRHGGTLASLKANRYVAIYIQCSGLNSDRFKGKGQTADAWQALFAYMVELWFAQHLLDTVFQMSLRDLGVTTATEANIVADILDLFDIRPAQPMTDLSALRHELLDLQHELDAAVNNAAVTGSLALLLRISPGAFSFGIPRCLAKHVPALSAVQFLYLIDEFENLDINQQRHLNTLIREKQRPTSFIIGSRLYGFRTRETNAAGEVNRHGSEFKAVYLDRTYARANFRSSYAGFCQTLVAKRLVAAKTRTEPSVLLAREIPGWFVTYGRDRLGDTDTAFMHRLYDPRERPYLNHLYKGLDEALNRGRLRGLATQKDLRRVVEHLRVPDHPMVEKANLLLFYRAWYDRHDLSEAADAIRAAGISFVSTGKSDDHVKVFRYYRLDLLAQMLREGGQRQRYLGFDAMVRMSTGMPRNLVQLLQYVLTWARFDVTEPFRPGAISEAAQTNGVKEASAWFYDDAPGVGYDTDEVQAAVTRLGDFLRRVRYSDRLIESSLVSFSVDEDLLSDRARRTLRTSADWALLVPWPEGTRDRNTARLNTKYQLNGMLSPMFDLPLARRGVTPLLTSEANAIFDSELAHALPALLADRMARLNAPFLRQNPHQGELFAHDEAGGAEVTDVQA